MASSIRRQDSPAGPSRSHSPPPPYENVGQWVAKLSRRDTKNETPKSVKEASLSAEERAERRSWEERVLAAERREIAKYGTPAERRRIEHEDRRHPDPGYHRERLWQRNFGSTEDVDADLQRVIEMSIGDLEAQTMIREKDDHPVVVPLGTRPDGSTWVPTDEVERAELEQLERAIKESLLEQTPA